MAPDHVPAPRVPFARLIPFGILLLAFFTVALNALTLHHYRRLSGAARALERERVRSVGAQIRRAVRPRPWRPAEALEALGAWLEEGADEAILAVHVVQAPDRVLFSWERVEARFPLRVEALSLPTPPRRRGPPADPMTIQRVRDAEGEEALRGVTPIRGFGRRQGRPHDGPLVVIDVSPSPAATLRQQGRLLVAGGLTLSLALWLLVLLSLRMLRRTLRLQGQLAEERQLAEIGRMSGVLAHQIRNPLAAIKGHAQLGLERIPADHASVRSLERVVDESSRLEGLADRLLRYVRPMAAQRAPLVVGELLERAAADHDDPRISCAVAADLGALEGDALLLREALAALLANAAEAAAPDGRIVLSAVTRREGGVCLRVEDDGPGMAPGLLAEAARPFVTTRTAGTGLGLAIVARIARAHGGALVLERRVGGGLRATMELPQEDA
jgi:signal transduction histidine kinase